MIARVDFSLISSWIEHGTRVLDLGCGKGSLLKDLSQRKSCRIQGVELDPVSHMEAVRDGVPVIQLDMDKDLDMFKDASYDVVILSRTLQAVRFPEKVLRQMLRIAPIGIVSMPNFAYWRNRISLSSGRAPVSKDLPYAWYDSPNIHFGSCADLETLFAKMDLEIMKCVPLSASGKVSHMPIWTRNWSAGAALYELSNRGSQQ